MWSTGEDPGHVEAAQEEAAQPAVPGPEDGPGPRPGHRPTADRFYQRRRRYQ